MHFSVLSTTCGRRPERLECKFHALPFVLFSSLFTSSRFDFFVLVEHADHDTNSYRERSWGCSHLFNMES